MFIPAKVRELYLAHMLETLEEQKIRCPGLLQMPYMLVTCLCQGLARTGACAIYACWSPSLHVCALCDALPCRSVMVFAATCRGCHLLSLLMQELRIPAAALHSHLTQGRRLASLEK